MNRKDIASIFSFIRNRAEEGFQETDDIGRQQRLTLTSWLIRLEHELIESHKPEAQK